MQRTITVKGIGKTSVSPDFVILSIELEARHKEYGQAMDIAVDQVESLKSSLISGGFEKDAVKTVDFSVDTDYDRYTDRQGEYHKTFNGFICHHQLKLSFDFDMERLSKALTIIAACSAHPEFTVSFTVKDVTAVNDILLHEAAISAKKKAEVLCEVSDVKLGQLLTIDYSWSELNIYSDTCYAVAGDCSDSMMRRSIDIEPDDIKVSDTATFVWEVE